MQLIYRKSRIYELMGSNMDTICEKNISSLDWYLIQIPSGEKCETDTNIVANIDPFSLPCTKLLPGVEATTTRTS
jgi:hypothetical protein